MNDSDLLLAALALCVAALWVLSPSFRRGVLRALLGPPPLRIEELPDLLNGDQSFHIDHNPAKKMPGADRSVQMICGKISIIYHVSRHPEGTIETVDISYPGKLGMIFMLVNDKMVSFERIGGAILNNPALTGKQEHALTLFMIDLRECFA